MRPSSAAGSLDPAEVDETRPDGDRSSRTRTLARRRRRDVEPLAVARSRARPVPTTEVTARATAATRPRKIRPPARPTKAPTTSIRPIDGQCQGRVGRGDDRAAGHVVEAEDAEGDGHQGDREAEQLGATLGSRRLVGRRCLGGHGCPRGSGWLLRVGRARVDRVRRAGVGHGSVHRGVGTGPYDGPDDAPARSLSRKAR